MSINPKKIINFTPTGNQTNRGNSYAPLDTQEIIDCVLEAYEIGITLVHLHARDENLQNTWKSEYFQKIIEGIKKYTEDLVICVSLSGRNFPELYQRTDVLQLKPDMASLTLSSLNFINGPSVNSPDIIVDLIKSMENYGVIPELECFDSGMLNMANYLISKNILKPPYYFNFILGNLYNAQCDLSTIADIKSKIPQSSIVALGGIGSQQLKSNMYGLLDFDGCRVGLEDNLYFQNKEKATNLQLLKRLHNIMNSLNFEVMRSQEFRNLGYENKLK